MHSYTIQKYPIHFRHPNFSCDASNLGLGANMPSSIALRNMAKNTVMRFKLTRTILTGPTHEREIGGWLYTNKTRGITLHIWND